MRLSTGVIPLILAASVQAVPFKRYDNSSAVSVSPSSSGFTADIVNTGSSAAPSSSGDTTITIQEYKTITLPDTTMTVPTSASDQLKQVESSAAAVSGAASSSGDTTLTSTVIEYQTLSSGGSQAVKPTNTYTTKMAAKSSTTQVTTSTITRLTTITEDSSVITSAVETGTGTGAASNNAAQCTPETVTVTVTKGEDAASASDDTTSTVTLTSTRTTSYPVEAKFTHGDETTTLTSYVQVTSTEVYTTATASSAASSAAASSAPFGNHTIAAVSTGAAGNNGTFYSSALPSASAYEPVGNARRGIFHF